MDNIFELSNLVMDASKRRYGPERNEQAMAFACGVLSTLMEDAILALPKDKQERFISRILDIVERIDFHTEDKN